MMLLKAGGAKPCIFGGFWRPAPSGLAGEKFLPSERTHRRFFSRGPSRLTVARTAPSQQAKKANKWKYTETFILGTRKGGHFSDEEMSDQERRA
jgi:hypothetical protein